MKNYWASDDYKEWLKLAERDYHLISHQKLDYSEIRDKLVEDERKVSLNNQQSSNSSPC